MSILNLDKKIYEKNKKEEGAEEEKEEGDEGEEGEEKKEQEKKEEDEEGKEQEINELVKGLNNNISEDITSKIDNLIEEIKKYQEGESV